MDFSIVAFLSLCILIPAVIGLIRFKKINEIYYPFIYCIWLGLVNEIASILLAKFGNGSDTNTNIYMLLESLLLILQFNKWKRFEDKKIWPRIIMAVFLIFWLVENFIIADIFSFNSYFSIFYSSVITFLSIGMINKQIVIERRSLLKNPIFILCIAFVMYYTYNVLSEVFWIYGISLSKKFMIKVYYISVITNFISIILYSLAILWMPIKHRFTLPSS